MLPSTSSTLLQRSDLLDSCTCPAEYVRNHGAVPKLEWDTHKVTVTGMVDKPMTFTMNDLVTKFENVTLLCTLVCAGNRRKEQNMIKKTKGFNWGASGTGTGAVLLRVSILTFEQTGTLQLWSAHILPAATCQVKYCHC